MNNSKIWLSSPHMGGNEQKFVNEAFDTNWVAPLGPNVTNFEIDLEKYVGENSHVAALSSGTSAIHLALILLGVEVGDEILCQSMTFSASGNPIMYMRAIPIFIDSELETWNLCPIALENAIIDRIAKGKKPKAIIGVHLYGMPFKAKEILAISIKYDIPLIEDSAEALGSSYFGQKCGTFGQIGILSFNGNKIITTSGGGALVAQDKSLKDKAIFLATQARDNAPHYQHSQVGYNYRMSNICAGIGRGQMEVLDKHISFRRGMHDFYIEFFSKVDGVKVLTELSNEIFSNHWLSAIVLDSVKVGKTREDLRLAFEEANIESRPLWKPLHLQPIFEKYPYYGEKVSEKLFEDGLCLPSGSNLGDQDRNRIKSVLTNFFNI